MLVCFFCWSVSACAGWLLAGGSFSTVSDCQQASKQAGRQAGKARQGKSRQGKAKQSKASKQASNATQANIKAFTATVETSEQQAGANQLA